MQHKCVNNTPAHCIDLDVLWSKIEQVEVVDGLSNCGFAVIIDGEIAV
ncbi:MAG: hypothetical protein GX413_11465 [Acetobacter sp.]|nr:hypothetical protein [Acetobacter sp.]